MFDATTKVLEKTLDLRMRAHEVHTSNIANANVPDFKARKIDFEERLRQAIDSTETAPTEVERDHQIEAGMERLEADIYEDPIAKMKGDGNTVNMEREQTELAKNTIAYQAAVELLNRKFAMQKLALGGEGR